MNLNEYQELASRTQASALPMMNRILVDSKHVDLLHAALGLTSEAGEFCDALKKAFAYGRELDRVNLAEELGDLMWYIGLACDALDVTLESVCAANIAKLQKRYPEKFADRGAESRDFSVERAELEFRLNQGSNPQ
jgi:NTP pyrophosphatase (non-canonical NTP hydrolase)